MMCVDGIAGAMVCAAIAYILGVVDTPPEIPRADPFEHEYYQVGAILVCPFLAGLVGLFLGIAAPAMARDCPIKATVLGGLGLAVGFLGGSILAGDREGEERLNRHVAATLGGSFIGILVAAATTEVKHPAPHEPARQPEAKG